MRATGAGARRGRARLPGRAAVAARSPVPGRGQNAAPDAPVDTPCRAHSGPALTCARGADQIPAKIAVWPTVHTLTFCAMVAAPGAVPARPFPPESMFPFLSRNKMSDAPETHPAPAKTPEAHPLDALTGGAFSAATSGERAPRIRDWLATQPAPEQLQEVFKELSGRDKGAARAVREKLDELRRAKGQEAIAAEWAAQGRGAAGRSPSSTLPTPWPGSATRPRPARRCRASRCRCSRCSWPTA